jgi:uncharacterized protein YjiS (DUF1127 family)
MAFVPSLITLFSPLARRAATVMRALENRRAIRRLTELDAHQLKDIGLTRGQVIGALETPLLHDPSATLLDVTGRGGVRRRPLVEADAPVVLTPREA